MRLITRDGLAKDAFDEKFLRRFDGFAGALVEAAVTGYDQVEPSHFFLALLKDEQGLAAAKLASHGLKPEVVASTVARILQARSPNAPLGAEALTAEALSPRTVEMLSALEDFLAEVGADRCGESHFLWAVLRHLEEDIAGILLDLGGFDPGKAAEQLRQELAGRRRAEIFREGTEELNREVFSSRGWRVLELARVEAEAYGLPRIDSLVFLLALASIENGVCQRGFIVQGRNPRSMQERVALNLRRRPKRSSLPLVRSSFFESVQRVLEQAYVEAVKDGKEKIGESHLLRAFLLVPEGPGRALLEDMGVDAASLYRFACRLAETESEESAEEPASSGLPSFEEIEARLREAIVGQEEAIRSIMPYIKRARFGSYREGRPAGVFLFVGDPGVGKTQMAKLLAEAVYGSPENLIMIEMGQMGTSESRSLLIGAPPGYVGYGEGKLTNGLRDKPRSVVLFDEIEKAHPLVFDVLLRFLNEGMIEDPAGPVRDGRQCLVVLTSNLPLAGSSAGNLPAILEQLRAQEPFRSRPELLSRVDVVVPFRSLTPDDFREIARRQLRREAKRLKEEKQIELVVDDEVVDLIAERSYSRRQGARAVDREITELVVVRIIDLLEVPRPARVRVRCAGNDTVCEEID